MASLVIFLRIFSLELLKHTKENKKKKQKLSFFTFDKIASKFCIEFTYYLILFFFFFRYFKHSIRGIEYLF